MSGLAMWVLSAGLELGQVVVVIGGGEGDESGVEELEDFISNVGKIGLDLDIVFVAVALLLCSMEVRRCASLRSGHRWLQWLCARRGDGAFFGYEMDSIE
ncbi:hypothetical protein FCV25MIE_03235 [Fagus crenata]